MSLEKNKKSELISVIIPVYNVEKYLPKCIQSIQKQTYSNLEIILVNDGSTDKSGNICDDLALLDSRIVVFHKENGGLSDARNYGIEHATGNYIGFVDSDDYIEATMFEQLYCNLKKFQADISVCGYRMIYEESYVDIFDGDEVKLYDNTEAFKVLFERDNIGIIACNKLYKTSLFNGVRYPIGQCFEDINTTYKLIAKSNKIVYLPAPLYFYVQRKDSINGKNFKNETFNLKLYDMEFATDEVVAFVKNNFPEAVENISIGACDYYLRIINQEIRFGKCSEKLARKTQTLIRKNITRICRYSKLMLKKKLQMIGYAYLPIIYVIIVRFFYRIRS